MNKLGYCRIILKAPEIDSKTSRTDSTVKGKEEAMFQCDLGEKWMVTAAGSGRGVAVAAEKGERHINTKGNTVGKQILTVIVLESR